MLKLQSDTPSTLGTGLINFEGDIQYKVVRRRCMCDVYRKNVAKGYMRLAKKQI